MDPTKSFDHLDPKLKETYARVMGTSTTPDPAAGTPPVAQPAADPSFAMGTPVPPPAADPSFAMGAPVPTPAADPSLSATPPTAIPPGPLGDPAQSQISANPMEFNTDGDNPNPGTGPTIGTMPQGTSTMFSAQPADSNPAPDTNSPTTSSFFSNPSPAVAETPQTAAQPVEPAGMQAPVTPYVTENVASIPPPVPNEFSQPLPSPASVAHPGTKQSSALLKVLYIVAAVVFFAVYTIFWIKIFNLPFIF